MRTHLFALAGIGAVVFGSFVYATNPVSSADATSTPSVYGDNPPPSSYNPEDKGQWEKPLTVTQETTTSSGGTTSSIKEVEPISIPASTVTSVQPNESATRTLVDTTTETKVAPLPAPVPAVQNMEPAKAVTAEKPQNQLQNIGASLRQLQQEMRRIEVQVRTTVSQQVDDAINKAASRSEGQGGSKPVNAFDPVERERRLVKLRQEVAKKQNQISEDVRSSIASGNVDQESLSHLEPVLKSSLADIELLIKDETGATVDLSPSARAVTSVVADNTEILTSVREEFLSRGGLDLYKDTDRDGVSDYDEKHIYNTDPLNAFTAGSLLTDGERILLGLDVYSKSNAQVPVESPRTAGEEVDTVFEVHSINVRLIPLIASTSLAAAAPTNEGLPSFREEMTFSGRALPNSFVTLYIFSTPIVVTVKAGISGAWSYTLNTELPDGSHELYVATVDAGGKIIAKSPAVPFVKEAQAAAFTPLLIAETPDVNPLDVLENNLVVIGIALLLIFGVAAVTILSARRAPPTGPTASA